MNEALAVVKAVRDRHDGTRRNPFDEFECGHHYARAMASWAVLNALTGFAADLPARRLAFFPRFARTGSPPPSSASGRVGGCTGSVLGAGTGALRGRRSPGSVEIRTLGVPEPPGGFTAVPSVRARAGGGVVAAATSATARGIEVRLARAVRSARGKPLVVEVGPGSA